MNQIAKTRLRQAAVAASRRRAFGTVTVITPPSAAFAWLTACAVLLLLAAAAYLVELPLRVPAVGVLMPPAGFVDVIATESGIAKVIHVTAGQEVAAGAMLIDVDSAGTSLPGEAFPQITLQSLRDELALLTQAQQLRQQLSVERQRGVLEQEAAMLEQISAAEQRLQRHRDQQTLLERRLQRTEALAAAGHLARDALEQQQLTLMQARGQQDEGRQRLLELRLERARLVAARREMDTELALHAAEQRLQTERLQRQIGEAGYKAQQKIRSTASGVVARILVSVGGSVRAGQVVAKLYRQSDPLEAWLYLSSANARLLRKGQTVRLLLDAYPKERFGTLAAEVTWVAAVALAAEEIGAPAGLAGPVFEIRARLAEADVALRGRPWTLRPGTTFRAEVIQQRLKLYEWLLRSVASA